MPRIFLLVFVLLSSGLAHGAASGALKNHFQVITAPELWRWMQSPKPPLLIDTLSRIEFAIQHISGSINIPANEVATTTEFPSRRDAPIGFYCMGPKCNYRRHPVEVAIERGNTQAVWFRGGIPEWRRFDYTLWINPVYAKIRVPKLSCAEANVLLDQPPAQRPFGLNVRLERVIRAIAFLPGTVPIPSFLLDRLLERLPKDRPILITDVSMRQSVVVGKYLMQHGYNVFGGSCAAGLPAPGSGGAVCWYKR